MRLLAAWLRRLPLRYRSKLGAVGGAHEVPGHAVAGTGCRNVGRPRRLSAIYALENDGVAGVRSRDQTGRRLRLRSGRALWSVAKGSGSNSRTSLRPRLQHKEEGVHTGLWV